jgi:acyl-CoA reductase-like NAD-dependent aldehyde dehydrogenase
MPAWRAIHGETIENSLPGEIFSYTLKEPVGVGGAIIPWNGPLTATIWKIGPVPLTGCTVVLKPAEEAPLTPLRLGELCMEAGIPEGVINIVPGYGETAGAALAAHWDVDKIAFTGSHLTGQKIIEASAGNLKRVSLELGGKSLDVVFADADLDEISRRANATNFGLGSGVWTRDVSKAHRLAKAIRAGSVWVNCYQAMDPAVPFGGYKMSGYGRESGLQQFEEYLNVKAVWIKTA